MDLHRWGRTASGLKLPIQGQNGMHRSLGSHPELRVLAHVFFVPPYECPYWQNGHNNTQGVGLLWGLNGIRHAMCLAHSRWSISTFPSSLNHSISFSLKQNRIHYGNKEEITNQYYVIRILIKHPTCIHPVTVIKNLLDKCTMQTHMHILREHTYIHTYIHTCTYIRAYTYTYLYTCTCIYTYICTYI